MQQVATMASLGKIRVCESCLYATEHVIVNNMQKVKPNAVSLLG